MKPSPDPLELTRELIRIKSISPPGDENLVADYLAPFLEQAGFGLERHDFGPGRTNLIARLEGRADKPPLAFTGHFDVVPLGDASWSVDPFGGEIDGEKICGRGSSDMKSGLAAIVDASCRLAGLKREERPGLVLIFTAGEENGLIGGRFLADSKTLPASVGALVVAEPTSNQPMLGHKGGALLHARTRGKTAHGSMPQMGDNAVYKAARAIIKLEEYGFAAGDHPQLGAPTLSVGTVQGGAAPNVVPDLAEFSVDLRIVPGQDGLKVLADLKAELGPEVEWDPDVPIPGIWTDPKDPWVESVFGVLERLEGERPLVRGVSYLTDASVLLPALGAPPDSDSGPRRSLPGPPDR